MPAVCSVPCRSRVRWFRLSICDPPALDSPLGSLAQAQGQRMRPRMGCLASEDCPIFPHRWKLSAGGVGEEGDGGPFWSHLSYSAVSRRVRQLLEGVPVCKKVSGAGWAAWKPGSHRGGSAGPGVRTEPCRAGFPRAHHTTWHDSSHVEFKEL